MRVVTTRAECRAARPAFPVLGLVPTMGYLHAGHLSLVRRARAECGAVAVSIFVNPAQFGPHEDLARYPRDLPRDLQLLEASGTDLVFTPTADEIYPPGFAALVDPGPLGTVLEGKSRPGHFTGVATVVVKLLNIIQPTRAYFGQKDAQQVAVIRAVTRDLDMTPEIAVGATVREPDGLALSSRNVYLSPAERAAAPVLYRALLAAEQAFLGGERDAERLRRIMREVIAAESLANPDYVSVADPLLLRELAEVGPSGALLSLAAGFGKTRLIDNLVVTLPG